MMRSHGIAPPNAAVKPSPSRAPAPKVERRESKERAPKKRKAEGYMNENATVDDEEDFDCVKPDPTNDKEQFCVKEEEPGQLSMDDAANLVQYYNTPYNSTQPGGSEGYIGSPFETGSAAYPCPIGDSYGLQAQDTYGFPYSTPSMNSIPAPSRGIHYEPMMPYSSPYSSTDNQGGSDSPVIVE
jgi:hypothetical protein